MCRVDQWSKSFDLAYQKVARARPFLGAHGHYSRGVRRKKKIMAPGKPHNHMDQLGHAKSWLGQPLSQVQSKLWSDT